MMYTQKLSNEDDSALSAVGSRLIFAAAAPVAWTVDSARRHLTTPIASSIYFPLAMAGDGSIQMPLVAF